MTAADDVLVDGHLALYGRVGFLLGPVALARWSALDDLRHCVHLLLRCPWGTADRRGRAVAARPSGPLRPLCLRTPCPRAWLGRATSSAPLVHLHSEKWSCKAREWLLTPNASQFRPLGRPTRRWARRDSPK